MPSRRSRTQRPAADANRSNAGTSASASGRASLVAQLLRAGVDPNAADKRGETPLHIAAHLDAPPELVRDVVLAGASLDCADKSGRTPLEVGGASATFVAAVVEAVAERSARLDKSFCSDLPTPLHRAVACSQPGVLCALLEQGHSPDVASSRAQATPLILAARLGHDECVRELLAASADTEAADGLDNTASFYAAEGGHWHCLRRLLRAGARCNTACEFRLTALHTAAHKGHEACLLSLLEAGAAIDATDEQGLTALQLAALEGQEHCVHTLLLAGAALPTSFPGIDEEAAAQAQSLIQEAAQLLLAAPDADGDSAAAAEAAEAASPAEPAASAAAAALDDALLSDVCCPITHELMEDPVLAADGTTYERQAIAAWIARQQAAGQPPTSPVTNLPLEHTGLTENRIAKAQIGSLRAAGLLTG
ncbi:ankyrin repeat [Chlorella sorokiniana]|uniref:Ankyrin repeat n=1 Tax=Chlorella sorokiniana TaxID=3076 RepID=A0A2P6TQT0_CHLSO|nr:ankyrin repeat [Chlorella sorokiniana]|eukprot:PRW56411.1 ankyrin repeat [Chlorella sorokiniana]